MAYLEAANLSKTFGGLRAVDDVSLSVDRGEIVGIIGPNGAGKSTLFNLVAGVLKPDRGRLALEGRELTGLPAYRIARLGVVKTFQLVKPFTSLTVLENVMVACMSRGCRFSEAEAEATEFVEVVGLRGLENAAPGMLPHAQRRRLEIARALAAKPKILLLDEALAGLNQVELAAMLETLRRLHGEGLTILLIEHVLEAAMTLCERIVVIDEGKQIAGGTPAEVARNPLVIEAYLGKWAHNSSR